MQLAGYTSTQLQQLHEIAVVIIHHSGRHQIKCQSSASDGKNKLAQVVDDYCSKSFRLLAMAVGTIQNASKLNLAHMTPQQVEASATNMRLLALIVLTNNMRPDSKETIARLQEGYACPVCSCGPAAVPPRTFCSHRVTVVMVVQWFNSSSGQTYALAYRI